jgi:hypothetical protein
MYARAVDDAGVRLRELRREEWQDLGLGAVALGLALAATQARPALALPLFLGGVVVGSLGLRALWRRWELLERLAGERDAYVIPEVRSHATREASMERRRSFAAVIRGTIGGPARMHEPDFAPVAEELGALASELDDAELALDPACAVACGRLLSDPESLLFDPAATPQELRSRVRQIRDGFGPRPAPEHEIEQVASTPARRDPGDAGLGMWPRHRSG